MSFFAALFLLLLLSGGGHHHHDHHDAPPAPELTPEQRQAQFEATVAQMRESATIIWPFLSFFMWIMLWFRYGQNGTVMGMGLNVMLLWMGYGVIVGVLLLSQMVIFLCGARETDDKRKEVAS